jgi:hypothetical protein
MLLRNRVAGANESVTHAENATVLAERQVYPDYGGVPAEIRARALARLDDRLRSVVEEFEARFPHATPRTDAF